MWQQGISAPTFLEMIFMYSNELIDDFCYCIDIQYLTIWKIREE